MIKTQIVKEGNQPLAVILDYLEYKRLKEIEMDKEDYNSAITVKRKTKTFIKHNDLKRRLGIN